MTDVKPSAAVEMTLLTKERPLVSEMKAWIEEHGGGMMIPFSVEFEENKWGLKDAGAEAMAEFMKDKEGAHMLPRIIKQVRG